ncbi:ABC transporter permease subunit [Paenibacillus dokdonensis]|uniref:ABC transporter permease subunit n=1 Tax=Paenibacillus dokdonensis TaxID=2567944 RepID=A0ABU6GPA3_9BACL|nr:ABC transporter permease subunit [Paenibacillus dokdonensis]MEC0241258.1 ABC transporter permease subunit [Paenibacillus dokdonensis]
MKKTILGNIPSAPVRPAKPATWKRTLHRERNLWLICLPLIAWVILFNYVPMYGILMAFVDYIPGKSIFTSDWVGLKHFKDFIHSPDFSHVLRNTLAISGLNILFGFPAPIVLALLLNELRRKKFKQVVQTISYLPHFISWVVVASILFTLLGNEGILNDILLRLGWIGKPISFLGEGKYFWGILTAANIWKDIGWSTIIYLSAMAGVDSEVYEAGRVDGLGRLGAMWHITLPGIRTTIVLLWILGIGGILNAGFEQQLLIGNAQTREYYEVVDTYAYKYGIQLGNYSYGAAVGLMKAMIAVILVFGANRVSKKVLDTSIF